MLDQAIWTASIPRVGLGCMGMSEFYGPVDDQESLRALRAAYEIGYRHFDTADMYGRGANERLLGRFVQELGGRRDELLLATKVGIRRDPDAPRQLQIDSSPAYLRAACDASLQRLGVERIDLLYVHRRTPEVPIEDTVGALLDLIKQGKIRAYGLSEVSATTLRHAHGVHPVSAVQSEYSLWTRDPEPEILPTCAELGIRFVAYSPLGRGFLAQRPEQTWSGEQDLRQHLPRFQKENVEVNQRLVAEMAQLSASLGLHVAELALSWVLHQRDFIQVIPGSQNVKHVASNFGASRLRLDETVVERLRHLFRPEAVSGERYPEHLLGTVNV
jgi:aryl-alcohol dehydrogenase-like predicted oxidoreductase